MTMDIKCLYQLVLTKGDSLYIGNKTKKLFRRDIKTFRKIK